MIVEQILTVCVLLFYSGAVQIHREATQYNCEQAQKAHSADLRDSRFAYVGPPS